MWNSAGLSGGDALISELSVALVHLSTGFGKLVHAVDYSFRQLVTCAAAALFLFHKIATDVRFVGLVRRPRKAANAARLIRPVYGRAK